MNQDGKSGKRNSSPLNFTIVVVTAADVRFDRGDSIHVRKLFGALRSIRSSTLLHRGIADAFGGTVASGAELSSVGNVFKMVAYHLFLIGWLAFGSPRRTVVYARDWSVAIAALLVRPFRRFSVVYEVNGIVSLQMPLVSQSPISLFAPRFQVFAIRLADHVVSVTKRLAETVAGLAKVDRNRISIIPNATDVDPSPIQKSEARLSLGISIDSKVVGFVGNLTAWQGVDTLLDAFALISSRMKSTLLIIVGDGPHGTELRAHAARLGIGDAVNFTGHVSHERALMYIRAFDVCVVPLSEKALYGKMGASPMKAYEYMAAERPIVTGAVSGLMEEVREAQCGLIAGEHEPHVLAEPILTLLADPQLSMKMGRAGRNYVERMRTWQSVARAVNEVCERTWAVHRTFRGQNLPPAAGD